MKYYNCNGFWKDSNEFFEGMIIASGEWDGEEDYLDEQIFYYLDGEPITGVDGEGDHGDFVITDFCEVELV